MISTSHSAYKAATFSVLAPNSSLSRYSQTDSQEGAANIIAIGPPIYFSYPAGETRSCMERLMFPILTYNPKKDEGADETRMTLLDRTLPSAMIYTIR